jgi:hypothetical protein
MAIQQNIVSYNNSSTIPLAANATFTGVFENVLQYQELSCFCTSDVGGTLYLDFSVDGLNVLSSFPFTSTGSTFFRTPSSQAYARVRYINGATLQTQFSLTTIYRPVAGGAAQVPFSNPVFDVSLAQNERAILYGKNAGGTYVQIPADTDTGLRVTSSLGTTLGKTNVLKTGTLTTTSVTVDQVVLTYTVTAGKIFYVQYIEMNGIQTTPAGGSAVNLGIISLEIPSGTKVIAKRCVGAAAIDPVGLLIPFLEPIPVAAGTTIRVVVTPATTSSFTWAANFGGYEK